MLLALPRRVCAGRLIPRRWCGGTPATPPASQPPREYFFYLNDHGNLYHIYDKDKLLGGDIPVGPAHLRDEKFLDFFFAMVKPNTTGMHEEFPWVSRCRGELNFMKASDRPIVFIELEGGDADQPRLSYGGCKLAVPFDPSGLAVCTEGRVYHPAKLGGMGLLSCHCAMRLGLDSIWDDTPGEEPYLDWKGTHYPLKKIPAFPPKFI